MWDFACLSLEMYIQLFFFLFLFSCYFCSVDAWVVSIISGRCNQSSSILFKCSLRVVSMHQRHLQCQQVLFFLHFLTYSVSASSLGIKALCIVNSFLVLWLIYLSSSLTHFKNRPEYLTRETALVLIILMRFLLYSLVSSSFLVLLKYSF